MFSQSKKKQKKKGIQTQAENPEHDNSTLEDDGVEKSCCVAAEFQQKHLVRKRLME